MYKTNYPNLFSPYTIKNLTFRNRIFATPAMTAWPDCEGAPPIKSLYDTILRAKGGAAVVTMGETSINRTTAVRANQIFLTQAEDLKGSTIDPIHLHGKLVEAVNRHGAIATIQLYHAGEAGSPNLGGSLVLGPVDYISRNGVKITGMTEEHMKSVCADYKNAARIAKNCGYQIIQIHFGHGWLPAQFLSPFTNKRNDDYGGCIENRARFPLQIIDAVRSAVGDNILIELRISGDEHVEGGMTISEVTEFISLARDKIDIVQVSGGCFYSSPQYTFPTLFQPHGINVENAAYIKRHVNIPVAVVGGLSDPKQLEEIIAEGKADFVCMTRQLLTDPDLPRKAYYGQEEDIRPCIRCSNCLGLKSLGHHNCDVNPLVANGAFILNSISPIEARRRVLIAGGGPGGMVAAITACDRGHEVILVEKTDKLGGMLCHSEFVPFKEDMRRYKDYLIRQVGKRDIHVMFNTECDAKLVDDIRPDAIIAAVGAHPVIPNLPGMDMLKCVDSLYAHEHVGVIGNNIVIIGGGLVGCETAIHMKMEGKNVTLIEMADSIARDANAFYRSAIYEQIEHLGINTITGAKCLGFSAGSVIITDHSEKTNLSCDTAVICVGMAPNHDTVEELRSKIGFGGFREIGDCYKPETIRQAVHHGYFAAMDIV
jgi:2,4-dienoyl-CoA reductase-like NADH-dependent reductase (Old Yellow Enzyme family)/thioredoxin reductase